MKIAFNPSTVAALITPPNNKDITFDLRGRNIFARGVKFCGTDTWRDIKINNVSIGSNILDLRNGSNTTLTNTNGVVTINSTWRPVVDNLTSDSTTSSLSAKQGKILKSLIDGKSNSGHNHDDRYLRLTGGTMASNALITFADSGSWGTDKGPQGARGGLYWTGQSDYAKLYAEETAGDNLDLVIQFGDDNSNGLSIRNKANTQTSYISSSGVITTGTFKGNLDWSYITNKPATATRWPSWAEVTGKPSSFTPSTHTHGLSNSVFFLNMPSISGNAKWKEVFGYPVNYNLLLSVRINSPAPEWCVGNYGSGILYGGSDTKGFMSSAYNEPLIMWAGGNGSSDDSVPKWYIGIKGIHKSIYNLATIASEANAAYNLRHSHANKSVLDGITSALVNNWNTAFTFVNTITGTDTDKVINKWDEIVNFLAGITEDNKLNTLLNSKLSVYELANNTNVGAIKNNGIYYSTTDASSGTLTNSPFNTGFALINMTSLDNGDDLRRSRLAFNAYGEIKVSDDRDLANTAETWYQVLTSKNSGISGSTIKLNGTSITVYSSSTADGRYVKKSGDTMSGTLTTVTTGSNSYNQGIRINRTATNQWATLLIGKSGTATTGTGTSTAGDGAWLIATPASSNSLIFNLNSASETVGLCLKGHGNTDIKWNNNTIWHAGNDGSGSGLDADTLDGWHLDSIRKNVGYSWSAKYRINNWSRIIKIDNYSNILLAINFSLFSQASNHLYLISTGYGYGNIVQLGANGFSNNSAIKIRLTENTATSHNVEIYSTYGYNGATELSINCNYTRIDGNSTITTYLTYTAGEGTVRKEITSSYSKIVANLQGNSDTTTKLQTARSIWGQSFDGTKDINGLLTHIISSDDLFLNVHDNRTSSGYLAIRYFRNGADMAALHWFHDKFGGYNWNSNCLNLDTYKGGYITLGCWDNPDLTVIRGGNIGISTTSPSYKLHVNGTLGVIGTITTLEDVSIKNTTAVLKLFKVINNLSELWMGVNSMGEAFLWTPSNARLILGTNNNHRLDILENGNVGIGTNTPSYKLHVNGTFRAANSTVSNLFVNTGDATLKIYTGITTDALNDGNICFLTSIDATDGQSHTHPTLYLHRCNIVLQPRGGLVYIGTNPGTGNTTYKLYVNSKIFSNGGFVKNGSSDSYVLLGGGGHKDENSLRVAYASSAGNADTVDGYHATDGRTFTGNINWSGNWNDTWSDGTNEHPWYGFDHRYPNTGAYSTTISDFFGMTIKTALTLRLDFGTLLLNGTSIYSINVASATRLQTARKIWGQSFDGTADISGTLSGVSHILFSADNTYNIGSNSAASKYIYTYWLGAKSGLKLELGANNSNFGLGLCIDTNLNVGIGTNTPAYKLHVAGDIYTTTGFKKNGSSDSYVLLGGGGHKLISDFATNNHTHSDYVTLTTTLTIEGSKTFTTGIRFNTNKNGDANLGSNDGFKLFYNETSGRNFPGNYYNVASFITGYTGFLLACYGGADLALKYRHREDNGTWHPWKTLAFTTDIPTSLPANGGNADTLDGTHLNGIFTAFGNNAHNITATIGGVTKSFLVNWAADSDKLDGYHENSFLRYRETTSIDLENTLWDLIGIKLYNGALPDNLTNVYNYGSVISLPCTSTRFEIYASELASLGNGLYYRSGWRDTKRPWLKFIDSSNIGSQSVNYANSAGNADKLDGYHASGLLTSVTNTNNGISVTVGGTTKSVSNISVNYANSAGSANSATQATNLTPENTPHYFRDPNNSSWRGGMYWGNAGNESMSFVAANGGTRFQFVGGSDIANWTSSTWQSVTPYLTIYSSGIVTPGSVTATNGFHHANHDNNDAVLLAGGGYSQGVPVKYWSIESISIYGPTSVSRTNRGGNYTFVTKVEPRIKGSCSLTLQFPSGYNNKNTIIWAMGVLNDDISDSDNSAIYATMLQFLESKYYLNLSDDDSLNNGTCQLYFMCF